MKAILLLFTLFAFALPASSAGFFTSIEDRADVMIIMRIWLVNWQILHRKKRLSMILALLKSS